MAFDDILEKIGPFGRYQVLHIIMIGIAVMPCGIQNMASVFLVGLPVIVCDVTQLPVVKARQFIGHIKPNLHPDGYTACKVYNLNYTELHITSGWENNQTSDVHVSNGTDVEACDRWEYDFSVFGRTIVTEWDLVCSKAWMRALASSIYMLGVLVGAIGFGSLADKLGRKPTWLISVGTMVVSGVCAAFIPNYWGHVFLRMVTGSASAGMFTVGFVLEMEMIGPDQRMIPGIFYQGWFALGYMGLPGLAMLTRDYTWTCFIISVCPVISLSLYWFLSESPRWLLTQGRREEAEKELCRAVHMNHSQFPTAMIEAEAKHLKQVEEKSESEHSYSIIDLLRTPNMRRKSLNVFYNWFVNSLVYYGLSLGVSDLVGSPYLNLFISGAVEFPGYVIAVMLLDRIGRRWPLAILMGGGGIACLLMIAIPSSLGILTTVLSMLGKLGISGSFAVIYVYSAELFPTVVRTTGVGAGSMSARVGGLIAPFVADLGNMVWRPLPSLIFGGCAVLGGLLALLLPETLHQKLPDTLEEGEEFGREGFVCCAKSPSADDKAATYNANVPQGNIRDISV